MTTIRRREARIGIIVEGVETEAQRSFLNSTGRTTLARGYYFSEAVVADEAGLRSGAIEESPQSHGFAHEPLSWHRRRISMS